MPSRASPDSIIEAARREFADHGYAGARVDRIAARAGLNKQLIYYYFGSKAGLHAAATAVASGSVTPKDATAADGVGEDLRSAVCRVADSLAARPDIVSLLVERNASGGARRAAREWLAGAQEDLAAAVSRAQGQGFFRDDVDPPMVARNAVVLCVGYLALAPHLGVASEDWVRAVGDTLVRAATW